MKPTHSEVWLFGMMTNWWSVEKNGELSARLEYNLQLDPTGEKSIQNQVGGILVCIGCMRIISIRIKHEQTRLPSTVSIGCDSHFTPKAPLAPNHDIVGRRRRRHLRQTLIKCSFHAHFHTIRSEELNSNTSRSSWPKDSIGSQVSVVVIVLPHSIGASRRRGWMCLDAETYSFPIYLSCVL